MGFTSDKNLFLSYYLQGDLQGLIIPDLQQSPAFTDGLWQHMCFEVFLATENEPSYQEFNFSPSGCWANYLFSGYRVPRTGLSSHHCNVKTQFTDNQLVLTVTIPLTELPLLDTTKPIQINLTAVIETTDGQRSYWAIHHPNNVPDFHDRAGFIGTLKPYSI